MNLDFIVFLDAGHGGLDARGRYVTSPSKEFKHAQGSFHKDTWFYEGVWNRTLTNRVAAKLQRLSIANLIVSHEYLDNSLQYRVDMANWYHNRVGRSLYISNHSNSSLAHNARGFELFTSPGQTKSDEVATMHFNNVRNLLADRIVYRQDMSDGDPDKESNFMVLRETKMPAILIEHLFFDHPEDARLLMDDDIVERFAEAQVRTIIQAMGIL